MLPSQLTIRQQIALLLTEGLHSSRDLARILGISERQVEEDLVHIARSLARNQRRQLVTQPSACHHCGFTFRDRTRTTRPSRCPTCRSEDISSPRFGIEDRHSKGR